MTYENRSYQTVEFEGFQLKRLDLLRQYVMVVSSELYTLLDFLESNIKNPCLEYVNLYSGISYWIFPQYAHDITLEDTTNIVLSRFAGVFEH